VRFGRLAKTLHCRLMYHLNRSRGMDKVARWQAIGPKNGRAYCVTRGRGGIYDAEQARRERGHGVVCDNDAEQSAVHRAFFSPSTARGSNRTEL